MAYSDYGGGGYSRGGADYGHGYGGGYEYDDGYERGNDEYSRGNEYGRGNEYSRGGGGGGGGRGYGGRGRGGGRGQSMGRGRGRGGRGGMRSAEGDGGDDKKKAGLIICIDYFYGTCSRGDTCMRPHVDYVESIGDRELLAKVKFCHDFQNRGECAKVGCKFLHVTRSEEDEFLLTGSIPPSVIERCSQDSVGDDSAYSGGYSSGNGGGRGRGGAGGRGGGRGLPRGRGGIGQKRSYDGDQGGFSKVPRGAGGARGGRGGRGDRGRGRGRGRGGEGVGHSTSLPVTYSGICVDYLKDSCTKGIACQLIHCDVVEDQDDRYGLVTSVFCHDFQNGACLRQFCKFVHASLSEENFFIENGYFPPTLNSRNKDKLLYSDICLDYLCNACTRPRCNYRHVEKVESINERLCLGRSIFCHDFQEGNCTRSPCKMVHMSKKGEEYFNETGCFPRDLFAAERGDNKVNEQQETT